MVLNAFIAILLYLNILSSTVDWTLQEATAAQAAADSAQAFRREARESSERVASCVLYELLLDPKTPKNLMEKWRLPKSLGTMGERIPKNQVVGCLVLYVATLPEINIAPKKEWLEDDHFPLLPGLYSAVMLVSGSVAGLCERKESVDDNRAFLG